MLTRFPTKSFNFFLASQASPAFPSDKNNIEMKITLERCWDDADRDKQKYWGRNCPNATLSTTNPRWTGPKSSASFCGETPTTNRL